MKISIDGLRRNMAGAYTKTVIAYQDIKSAPTGYDRKIAFKDLEAGLNELRSMIGGFMCVYSTDPEDDMSNMADDADRLPWPNPEDHE